MSDIPLEAVNVDGEGLRFGIVASRYNKDYVDALLESALRTLDKAGVRAEDIETIRVPGALEAPFVAGMLASSGEFDCLIVLGVIIKGDTSHHDVIARSTAEAFQRISRESEVPIINGVLDVNNEEQAKLRCMGKMDRGAEFATSALEMADLKVQLVRRLDEIYGSGHDDDDWGSFFDNDGDSPWKS
ncbi:MAG: 6,7-dimethyl-8-ribityllumazine synthase [Opitutales bacterium]|nr:6,7-dimethyl-8-ribityllumazine synthase [Opitutales bacterium]